MNDELMVSAICWEMDAVVSASFAHSVKMTEDFLLFCPDCLVDVAASISKKKNYFFMAPGLHKPGCQNEKRQSGSTLPARYPVNRTSADPEPVIPSHLGELPKRRKQKKPSMAERQALAKNIQPGAVLHPGTLREVVDAWSTMSVNDRKLRPLTVGGTQMTYYDAFAFMSSGGDISSLGCAETVVVGSATSNKYGDFYVTTRSKFKIGDQMLPIKARVRPGDPDFSLLEGGRKDFQIFLHGATPNLTSGKSYFHPPASTPYTGFVIKPKKSD
ncbi:hypothetical protein K5D56_09285 [Pseudomonas cichorii]|uniref:hypothetical protein n=1 Tax=Pseudomonas lijiangensis TaxID=2995658 RepID=UPI001C88C2F4|nr:hypothetical protein [Pseudomonas cichorii]MBX8579144.1 hypothetical protein [Pseudomonas cichorii]MBX8589558.1 hypothetical protein [Pseudomonas cichorii]MBX8615996.1 hypothetical protein [Pseudomonas cichorii]